MYAGSFFMSSINIFGEENVNNVSIIFKNLSNPPMNLYILPMMVEIAHIINEIVNIYALCTVKIYIEKSKLNQHMIEIAQIMRPILEKG